MFQVPRLHFEHIDVELWKETCHADWVMLFDWRNQDVTPDDAIGRFCGTDIPGDVTASVNQMLVLFLSDYSTANTGFSATFVPVPGNVSIFIFPQNSFLIFCLNFL